MSPATSTEIRLSPAVREVLGRSSASAHSGLTFGAKFLLALNYKATRTGSPVFAGVGLVERAARRAKGRAAKASRRANRGR
jgi:hypothetical protein